MNKKPKKTEKKESVITVKALKLLSNEIIAEGTDGDEVIKLANESGEEYILDFTMSPDHTFVF